MTMLEQAEVGSWQDLFASIIEDADSNILLVNEDFRVITLNPGFYWIFFETYGIELRSGSSILESMQQINPALTRLWKDRCLTAMSGMPVKVEDVFEMDGRFYHWEIHYKCTPLPDGRQVLSIFSRDITVRKAYQKRITENEANLRSILNTFQDSVWLINARYELIDFNKAFFKNYKLAFGVRLAKGKNIIDMLPSPELKALWQERYQAGLNGNHGKYEDSYWLDKELRTYEIKTYPIVGDGQVTGLTIYARDITQQKKTEDTLKAQNEELSKINSELDRFVYSASHDLRAPLMSVKGLLNMIQIDPDKKNAEQYLQLMKTSVDRLDHFITEIIHYSRNARMDIVPQKINFHHLVQVSIDSLKFMEDAEQVRSEIIIDAVHSFYSDEGRLLIIFNNIISNAVRYRDKRRESYLRIEITVQASQAIIRFTDNGIGIPEEYQEKVFRMFFRANADSKGSGLGLYIVRSTVDKLQGTISLQSQLGEGSTFEIVLPNLSAD
ncbi:MAG: ATP-binding protein [Bacteroidota bacterium]